MKPKNKTVERYKKNEIKGRNKQMDFLDTENYIIKKDINGIYNVASRDDKKTRINKSYQKTLKSTIYRRKIFPAIEKYIFRNMNYCYFYLSGFGYLNLYLDGSKYNKLKNKYPVIDIAKESNYIPNSFFSIKDISTPSEIKKRYNDFKPYIENYKNAIKNNIIPSKEDRLVYSIYLNYNKQPQDFIRFIYNTCNNMNKKIIIIPLGIIYYTYKPKSLRNAIDKMEVAHYNYILIIGQYAYRYDPRGDDNSIINPKLKDIFKKAKINVKFQGNLTPFNLQSFGELKKDYGLCMGWSLYYLFINSINGWQMTDKDFFIFNKKGQLDMEKSYRKLNKNISIFLSYTLELYTRIQNLRSKDMNIYKLFTT